MTYDEYIEMVKNDLRDYGKEHGFGPENEGSQEDMDEAMSVVSGDDINSPPFDTAQSMENIVPAMWDERYRRFLKNYCVSEVDRPEEVDVLLRLSVESAVGTCVLIDALNGRV